MERAQDTNSLSVNYCDTINSQLLLQLAFFLDTETHDEEIMAETIDDLTIEYAEDDVVIVKQLAKEVLTKGSWTTIMYKYQELDKRTGEFGAPKVSIRRYQKRNGIYRQQSKFNISSAKQANMMIEILQKFYADEGEKDEVLAEPTNPEAAAKMQETQNEAGENSQQS